MSAEGGVSGDVLWKLENVTLRTGGVERLCDVSAELFAPVTAVMGASGSGKTSLLNLLVEFERPTRGSVSLCTGAFAADDCEADTPRLPVFWAPQQPALWPQYTVEEHLRLVLPEADRNVAAAAADRIERLLDAFALSGRRDAYPATLSGGEAARTAVARALAARPRVLVLDEPLVHVGAAAAQRCWQAVMTIAAEDRSAVVFSSHDPEPVLRFARHVLCLAEGRTVFSGSVETLYSTPPTELAAAFLGPYNWLPRERIAEWLGAVAAQADTAVPETGAGESQTGGVCLRPETLRVELVKSAGETENAVAEADENVASNGDRTPTAIVEDIRRESAWLRLQLRSGFSGECREWIVTAHPLQAVPQQGDVVRIVCEGRRGV